MSDAVKQYAELKAVRQMIKKLDDYTKIGRTYNVRIELNECGAWMHLDVDHDTTRALLEQRRKVLIQELRQHRAAILRLADKLGDLETT